MRRTLMHMVLKSFHGSSLETKLQLFQNFLVKPFLLLQLEKALNLALCNTLKV